MKRILCICAVLMMALGTLNAHAGSDVSGVWAGDMKGPDGGADFSITFNFKQDGAKLTGTVTGPQGDAIEITDGKVDGDKISFKVSFNGMVIMHQGTVSGDEIKLSAKSDQMDMPGGDMTLKRTPAPAAKP